MSYISEVHKNVNGAEDGGGAISDRHRCRYRDCNWCRNHIISYWCRYQYQATSGVEPCYDRNRYRGCTEEKSLFILQKHLTTENIYGNI